MDLSRLSVHLPAEDSFFRRDYIASLVRANFERKQIKEDITPAKKQYKLHFELPDNLTKMILLFM